MKDINKLSLEELVDIHDKIANRLIEEFNFFEILNCSKSWGESTPLENGQIYITPYTEIYKDIVELYKQTKLSIEEQIEHLKEEPRLQVYIGVHVDRDNGQMLDSSSRLIMNKLNQYERCKYKEV